MLDVLAGSVVLVVTAHRLLLARSARVAGHADSSSYCELSRNPRAGRGPVIDYVWHFMPTRRPVLDAAATGSGPGPVLTPVGGARRLTLLRVVEPASTHEPPPASRAAGDGGRPLQ